MSLTENVAAIRDRIRKACERVNRNPDEVNLIAVTKYVDADRAGLLLKEGIIHLGENRDGEFLKKFSAIGRRARWHFIGTLQTRKVKRVIPYLDYLHSLDRISLAEEIQKRADRKIPCFVQVNVSGEETKHGIAPAEVFPFVKALSGYPNILVVGLMTIAPNTEDRKRIRSCFRELSSLQKEVASLHLPHAPCKELSMGMTNDFEIAVEEGATFVRIGRALWQ